MGVSDCVQPQEPVGNDEATEILPGNMPVRLTQSPNEPVIDSEQESAREYVVDPVAAAPADECSEVEIDMVRRLVANGRNDDARDLVSQLKDSREGSASLELLLSEIYIAESRLSDATACIMALLGKNPENPATLQSLVKLYRTSGDTVKALEVSCLRCSAKSWGASQLCSLSEPTCHI